MSWYLWMARQLADNKKKDEWRVATHLKKT